MGNGYRPQPFEGMEQIVQPILDMRRRLRELEAADGTQIHNTVQNLRRLVDGLINQTEVNVSGSVTAGGDITSTGGRGTFVVGVNSVGVYNTLLTYGGLYNSQYVHQDGTMGYVPSSRRFKQDIEPYALDLETLRQLRVVQFRYIAAVENLGDAAAVEVGLIAEDVDALGIRWLVDYDEAGDPVGLKRELFGLLALMWVQALDEQLFAQPQ